MARSRGVRSTSTREPATGRTETVTHQRTIDPAGVTVPCACGRATCRETILLPERRHRTLVLGPPRLVVVPGHEWSRDTVLEVHGDYLVVERAPAASRSRVRRSG